MSRARTLLAVSALLAACLPASAQLQIVPSPATDLNPNANLDQQKVGPDDLIGVQGLMPDDISVLVKEALVRAELYVDPFVTTTVLDYHSRPISVSGAVRTPTIFQAIGDVTLTDALARAGGYIPDQAGAEIIITKPNGDTGAQS